MIEDELIPKPKAASLLFVNIEGFTNSNGRYTALFYLVDQIRFKTTLVSNPMFAHENESLPNKIPEVRTMERYRYCFLNHFYLLFKPFVIHLILMIPVFYWFNFEKFIFVIGGIVFLIDLLPAMYLHLEYWYRNRGEEYAVTENEIIRYTDDQEEVFKAEEIKNCIVYRSASVDPGSWMVLSSMEQYNYARLLLRSGGELIITCLLMPKMDPVIGRLKGVPIKRKKRGFNPLGWK